MEDVFRSFFLYAYSRGKSQMSLSSLLHFDFFLLSSFPYSLNFLCMTVSVYLLLTHLFDIHGDTMKFSWRFKAFTNQHFTCFYRHHEDEMSHIFSFDAFLLINTFVDLWICNMKNLNFASFDWTVWMTDSDLELIEFGLDMLIDSWFLDSLLHQYSNLIKKYMT